MSEDNKLTGSPGVMESAKETTVVARSAVEEKATDVKATIAGEAEKGLESARLAGKDGTERVGMYADKAQDHLHNHTKSEPVGVIDHTEKKEEEKVEKNEKKDEKVEEKHEEKEEKKEDKIEEKEEKKEEKIKEPKTNVVGDVINKAKAMFK